MHSAPWRHRLAGLAGLLALVLSGQALLAPGADAASFVPISGSGSTVSAPAAAKSTATTFLVIPSGPVIQGTPVILVAQVAPANATGTVQFMDGDTPLGTPRPVFDGFALTVTSKLTPGTHSLAAMFTAANQAAFAPSTQSPVSLTVIGLS